MIGMGCAQKLIFSYVGNPGVGSLRWFRDAVENGWPQPLELEEQSHAGMASRYVAGASNLPFALLRGYVGTDLPDVTDTHAPITCPFTDEELMAVPALGPDVAIIHAQQADRRGKDTDHLRARDGTARRCGSWARYHVHRSRIGDRHDRREGGVSDLRRPYLSRRRVP